jgi:chemotaxis signal transduction protein
MIAFGTGDDPRAILERRAERLAKPLHVESAGRETIELLHFVLGSERYAIETSFVRRVVPVAKTTVVPGTPAHFVGVMNLAGEIVVLVDLAPLIGIGRGDRAPAKRAIVLGREHADLALVVDETGDIETIAQSAVDVSAIGRGSSSLVRGLCRGGISVLDGPALLDDPRFSIGDGGPGGISKEGTE